MLPSPASGPCVHPLFHRLLSVVVRFTSAAHHHRSPWCRPKRNFPSRAFFLLCVISLLRGESPVPFCNFSRSSHSQLFFFLPRVTARCIDSSKVNLGVGADVCRTPVSCVCVSSTGQVRHLVLFYFLLETLGFTVQASLRLFARVLAAFVFCGRARFVHRQPCT